MKSHLQYLFKWLISEHLKREQICSVSFRKTRALVKARGILLCTFNKEYLLPAQWHFWARPSGEPNPLDHQRRGAFPHPSSDWIMKTIMMGWGTLGHQQNLSQLKMLIFKNLNQCVLGWNGGNWRWWGAPNAYLYMHSYLPLPKYHTCLSSLDAQASCAEHLGVLNATCEQDVSWTSGQVTMSIPAFVLKAAQLFLLLGLMQEKKAP